MENDSKSTLRHTFAPGNAGTASIATNVTWSTDFDAIKAFVIEEK
jgi:hypothetical protein